MKKSKDDVIRKIVDIRFPDYINLQALRTPSLVSTSKSYELDSNEEDIISTAKSYESKLKEKSLGQCNAILKRDITRVEKEKLKEKEGRKNIQKTLLKEAEDNYPAYMKAAFEYWSKADTWTLEESVLLITNTDPRIKDDFPNVKLMEVAKSDKTYREHYLLAERAVEAGNLNTSNTPLVFITWANNKGLSVPRELNELVLKNKVQSVSGNNNQQTTIKSETDCKKWLEGLMSNNSKQEETKKHYKDEAKQRYGVGTKAFDRAWANAKNETNNTNWGKPGRKKS